MNRPSPPDDVERLAAVLAGVLATESTGTSAASGPAGSAEGERRRLALRGATAILPAILAMRQIQDWMRVQRGDAAWNGLLHRRCRMRPVPQRGDVTPKRRETGDLEVRQVDRAGWELLWARTEVETGTGRWQVSHELARRLQARPAVAVEAGKLTDGGTGIDPSADVRFCRLAYGDVAAWAEATGDGNPIHLQSGRAAEAGLRAHPNDVVAHGLLIGALSLALVQSSSHRRISLEFIGSTDVPTISRGAVGAGAALAVDISSGAIFQGGRPVLRRR